MRNKNKKFAGVFHPIEKAAETAHADVKRIEPQKHKTPPKPFTTEHETVVSRLTGLPHEISLGMLGDGNVPRNPFVSSQQQKFMYANPSILGKKGLKEWSDKTDFKSLPKKVKKK